MQTPATALLSVQLGEHHEAFLRWCSDGGRDPKGVVKQLVGLALSDMITPTDLKKGKTDKQTPRLRVNLGESHAPFLEWCNKHQVSAATFVRHWILEKMSKDHLPPINSNTNRVKELVGTPDASRVRVVLRMSESELNAWKSIASERKEETNKLMRRVLRGFLTKSLGFTADEASLLGTHNLLLLRSCNNLNQLAKHANSLLANGEPLAINAEALGQEVAALRSHVAHVASVLSSHRERWMIATQQGDGTL